MAGISQQGSTCRTCGTYVDDAGRYHPFEFCILRKAGVPEEQIASFVRRAIGFLNPNGTWRTVREGPSGLKELDIQATEDEFVKVDRTTVTVFDSRARVVLTFAINSEFAHVLGQAMEKAHRSHIARSRAARRAWDHRRQRETA